MKNRKILAALLLLPLLAFATDKMIGDDGKRNDHVNNNSSQNTIVSDDVETKKKVDEMVETIQSFTEDGGEFEMSERVSLWDEMVSEDLKDFVEKNVIKKLEKKKLYHIDGKNSFSRCPSGYRANIIVDNENLTNEGWMIYDSGCWPQPLSKFRYDVEKNSVEAYIGPNTGYVTLEEFFPIYKRAKMQLGQS